ncbi:MAG TPA: TetR/AcrR family transcriptional regulator [Solirubrobacteraceae bacterium]|nr:TetR/AcrR family transcriptional regulator [Solirubrobacteraceae bacterium]
MASAQSSATAQAPRLYRGLSASERQDQRREALLEAGLELFGTQGYAGSSIRAVSAAAALNSRYFYESFSSREDLLYHVYQRAVQDVARAIVEATAKAETVEEQSREGLRASWAILTGDRRKARVIVLEVVGVSERLERVRRENRHAMADILTRNALSLADPDVQLSMDPVLTSRALIGASMELLVDWIHGDVDTPTEQIVEQLTKMYAAVAAASVVQTD